jgi:hypothetical protein
MVEKPIVSSPLSFSGSTRRLWRPVTRADSPAAKIGLGVLVVLALMLVWTFILCWYLIFGLLVVPWRLIRRGQRRDKAYAELAGRVDRVEGPQRPTNKPTPWR